jgi:antitoxin component YwqK of YwqJK toxin-antitoxin module
MIKKTLFTFILCALIDQLAYSKADTVFYYMKTISEFCDQHHFYEETFTEKKEEANFIRAIISPDNTDTELYLVNDYYLNGKVKFNGKSKTSSYNPRLEGPCVEFFANGYRKKIANFHNGIPIGDMLEYFPNGHLNTVKTIVEYKGSINKSNQEQL